MRRFLAPVGLVAAATAACSLAWPVLVDAEVVVAYLLAVVGSATFGRGPALVAAVGAVASYNFFFVAPFHTLAVADVRQLGTFGALLAVGLVVGTLTDRIRAREAEVREVLVRARTDEIRAALLSSVSHDLRTPLAAITGSATTLRDAGDRIARDDRDALLDAIRDEAARMGRLVDDLLDTTRLTTGHLALTREWVPVDELVGTALRRVGAVGRDVRVVLDPALPLVSVDPLLLEQALVNLVSNALVHAPGSTVEVRAEPRDGAVRFAVVDHGPGLPPDRAPLFEPFVRGTSAAAGSGLGLAIVRGIVDAHGGRIEALDTPGGGATFAFALPRAGEPPTAAEAT